MGVVATTQLIMESYLRKILMKETNRFKSHLKESILIKGDKPELKVNDIITLFVVSGSIKKLFSIDCVNIYPFSMFFSIDFARWKSVEGTPNCLYLDSLTS